MHYDAFAPLGLGVSLPYRCGPRPDRRAFLLTTMYRGLRMPAFRRSSLPVIALLAAGLVACTETGSGVKAEATSEASVAKVRDDARAQPATASTDPCALLPTDALREYAGVEASPRRDRADEPYGIRTCIWGEGPDALVLQVFDAPSGALVSEARSRAFTLVDPKSPKAPTAVRLEAFPDVGDGAVALAERVDPVRGTRAAGATVLVQVGFRLVVVRAPALAAHPRDQALERLRGLAEAVAGRLSG